MAQSSDFEDDGLGFTKPRRFLIRMGLFLLAVLAVIAALAGPIASAFMNNPALNGLIAGVLIIGILYVVRQVLILGGEVRWIEQLRKSESGGFDAPGNDTVLLAPMANLLKSRGGVFGATSLSAVGTRSILDSVGARLDESREIARYQIGLLVFLGLLGTFWGLLGTVSSVGDTIGALTVGSGDISKIFGELKAGLAAPLEGMGTAFSSSLFGLAGSLVLGFLDLQAGQAQNRFYNQLEEWLSSMTRLTSGAGPVDGDQSVPAYVAALLEQTADSLDNLQRTLARTEERRVSSDQSLVKLADQLAQLTDGLSSERNQMMQRLSEMSSGGLDEGSRQHLRSIDTQLTRLAEETAQGRASTVEDLRHEIKLLARTLAHLSDHKD